MLEATNTIRNSNTNTNTNANINIDTNTNEDINTNTKEEEMKIKIQIKEADKAAMLEAINTNESASAHKDFQPKQIRFHSKQKERKNDSITKNHTKSK